MYSADSAVRRIGLPIQTNRQRAFRLRIFTVVFPLVRVFPPVRDRVERCFAEDVNIRKT